MPEEFLARMRRADAAGRAREEGMAIACEVASALQGAVQGVEISMAGAELEPALAVIESCAWLSRGSKVP